MSAAMRVLHAVTLHSPSHAFGGPVRVALNLTKGLRARGHEARLLALGEGFDPWPTEVEGVPAKLFPAHAAAPPRLQRDDLMRRCWPRPGAWCGTATSCTSTWPGTW